MNWMKSTTSVGTNAKMHQLMHDARADTGVALCVRTDKNGNSWQRLTKPSIWDAHLFRLLAPDSMPCHVNPINYWLIFWGNWALSELCKWPPNRSPSIPTEWQQSSPTCHDCSHHMHASDLLCTTGNKAAPRVWRQAAIMSVQLAMHASHWTLFVLQACSALVHDRHSTSEGGWVVWTTYW